MLLVSYEFLAFMAVLAVCYYLIPKRFQWRLLLAASYLFYALSGIKALIFIFTTTVSTWLIAKRIASLQKQAAGYIKSHELSREEKKNYKAKEKKRQWNWLLLGLFLNFGFLAVLKYSNFAIQNVNQMLRLFGSGKSFGFVSFMLPLGISYYTFQSMGYLIDIYRKKYEPEPGLFRFALFVSFFPQLIQGPITRFDEIKKELFTHHSFEWKQVLFGLQRILWGYFKKLVIADRILVVILAISQDSNTYQGIYIFIGMVCYTLQIYADFSGGIDIVIGIAQLFGIRLPENFNRPYFSKTAPEYWRRWHMSLMTWLREYIFYPASICKPVTRLTKRLKKTFGDSVGKRTPVYAASIIVWFVTGIWHGATWGFVAWGMVNCAVLLISQELNPLKARFHERYHVQGKTWFKVFQVGRTLLILSMIQMLEYYHTVSHTLSMLLNMLVTSRFSQLADGRMATLGMDGLDWLVVAAGTLLMFFTSMAQRSGSVREKLYKMPILAQVIVWYALFLSVLVLGAYGHGFDASQFIYNQF